MTIAVISRGGLRFESHSSVSSGRSHPAWWSVLRTPRRRRWARWYSETGRGEQVAAEILVDATNSATGSRIRDQEIHLWTFDDAGRVVRFRHYVDTAKHIAAAGVG